MIIKDSTISFSKFNPVGNGSTDNRDIFVKAEAAAVINNGNLVIDSPGTYFVNSNLTFNKPPRFVDGAKIKPASGVIITFNSGFYADNLQQIFDISSNGIIKTVGRSPYSITPQMFGAIANGINDDTLAIQNCINTWKNGDSRSSVFVWPNGVYVISKELDFRGSGGQIIQGGSMVASPAGIHFRQLSSSSVMDLGSVIVWQGADNDGSSMIRLDGADGRWQFPALWGRFTNGSTNKPTYGIYFEKDSSQGTGGINFGHLAVADVDTAFCTTTGGSGNVDRCFIEYFDIKNVNNGFTNDDSQQIGWQFLRVQAAHVSGAVFNLEWITNFDVGQVILNNNINKFLSFNKSTAAIGQFKVSSMKIDPAVDDSGPFTLVDATTWMTNYLISFSNLAQQSTDVKMNLCGRGSVVFRDSYIPFGEEDIVFNLSSSTSRIVVDFVNCRVPNNVYGPQYYVSGKSISANSYIRFIDCCESSNNSPVLNMVYNNDTISILEDKVIDIESDLVAHYKGIIGARDSSLNNKHGTWNGTQGYTNSPTGQGKSFTGFSSTNNISLPSGLLNSASGFTISAWAYKTAHTNFGSIFSGKFADSSGSRAPMIFHAGNGTGRMVVYANTSSGIAWSALETKSGSFSNLNKWFHIAYVYDGQRIFVYEDAINKMDPATGDVGNFILTSGMNPAVVGYYDGGGGNAWPGHIYDMRIYNRGLKQHEIKKLMELKPPQKSLVMQELSLAEQHFVSTNPPEGQSVIFQTSGYPLYNDGDVLIKTTSAGTTKTQVLASKNPVKSNGVASGSTVSLLFDYHRIHTVTSSGNINLSLSATNPGEYKVIVNRTYTTDEIQLLTTVKGLGSYIPPGSYVSLDLIHDGTDWYMENGHKMDIGYAQISHESSSTIHIPSGNSTDFSMKSPITTFDTNFSKSFGATPDHSDNSIRANISGVWELNYSVSLYTIASGEEFSIAFFRNNGGTQIGPRQTIKSNNIAYHTPITLNTLANLSKDDTVRVYYQRESGSDNIVFADGVFSMKKIGHD